MTSAELKMRDARLLPGTRRTKASALTHSEWLLAREHGWIR